MTIGQMIDTIRKWAARKRPCRPPMQACDCPSCRKWNRMG